MGSPEDELGREEVEGPVHEVQISGPFFMSKYEITQGQWQEVTATNPARFKGAGLNAPIESVKWDECSAFCDKLGLRLPSEAQWEYACRAGAAGRKYHFGGALTPRQANTIEARLRVDGGVLRTEVAERFAGDEAATAALGRVRKALLDDGWRDG